MFSGFIVVEGDGSHRHYRGGAEQSVRHLPCRRGLGPLLCQRRPVGVIVNRAAEYYLALARSL